MSELLESLRTRSPLPAWAPPPAPQPQKLHPIMAEIVARHFPLPAGQYPTARWPEGLEHLPQGAKS